MASTGLISGRSSTLRVAGRSPASTELLAIFGQLSQEHFDGFLDPPLLRWNPRLRSSAGCFIPGSRRQPRRYPPVIEVASYLRREPLARQLIRDTIAHEMIHYWLWVRRRPYGHTSEFLHKMEAMGTVRYNPAPRVRPYRYVYTCATCRKEFPARRRLGLLACEQCCQAYSAGQFDVRFRLLLKTVLRPAILSGFDYVGA